MPRYKDLKKYSDSEADWIATQLLALRSDLSRRITNDRQPSSLIVGSWNLVKFDGGMPRLDDSYHFIAEIIANFDICAIQEVMPDLEPLKKLLTLLGPDWNYFVSDASDHKGGNQERMAFVYNTNKVFFRNLIGEIVTDEHVARTPFFAAFQAGWFRFTLVSSHIVFGTEGLQARADEITAISKAIVRRAKSEDQVYIFLGDMNIESPTDIVMQALKESGLEVPDFGPTNMAGTKYDVDPVFVDSFRLLNC